VPCAGPGPCATFCHSVCEGVFMRSLALFIFGFAIACSSGTNPASNSGTSTNTTANTSTGTSTSATTQTSVDTSTSTLTSTITDGNLILYGSPYANVNMWEGPVNYTQTDYRNACDDRQECDCRGLSFWRSRHPSQNGRVSNVGEDDSASHGWSILL